MAEKSERLIRTSVAARFPRGHLVVGSVLDLGSLSRPDATPDATPTHEDRASSGLAVDLGSTAPDEGPDDGVG